jgi:hypothetical protein
MHVIGGGQLHARVTPDDRYQFTSAAGAMLAPPVSELARDLPHRGTTAVASISTRAAFSTRRTTWTSAIAG